MDIRKLKTILDLFENSSLAEMEFCEGEEKVRLSKFNTATAPTSAPAAVAMPPATSDAPSSSATENDADALDDNDTLVKSPMVGTFYRAAAPDKPPFARVGQSVKKGDTLCIVEAMKLMNEIPSPTDGVIKKILVENDDAVAYGTPLFVVA